MRIIPNSDSEPIEPVREAWSDAARAAALAARRARGKGLAQRKRLGTSAFYGPDPVTGKMYPGGVRDFIQVAASRLKRGDRLFTPHSTEHYFNVKSVSPARARGYVVVQGDRVSTVAGGRKENRTFFGSHVGSAYSVLRRGTKPIPAMGAFSGTQLRGYKAKVDTIRGPESLAVTAKGRRRRGYSLRSR